MKIKMDEKGRIVIPKIMRDKIGIIDEASIEISKDKIIISKYEEIEVIDDEEEIEVIE